MPSTKPVVILGAGINGAALARELVLNRVPVVLIDTRDIAAGTTSYSSRLIHGGLRYLEYGDFALVKESLAERTRWLRLAPHLVKPLRLYIPVRSRFGGLWTSARNFLGMPSHSAAVARPRGAATVRIGLWLYDRYARDRTLPRSAMHRLPDANAPAIDPTTYFAVCEYSDAQLKYPERFTVELLADARRLAEQSGTELTVLTYHQANLDAQQAAITATTASGQIGRTFAPAAVVNATGAWVDFTLAQLGLPNTKLMGGTKGTHLITYHPKLHTLLRGRGVYAEASDGRPVFVLPFGEATLVGTTDEKFTGDPDDARATPQELEYLVSVVNELFPGVCLATSDIELHYAGVRPLPRMAAGSNAAISRRHWLEEHDSPHWPLYSIIGGKLTTCRSLAEVAAGTILKRLDIQQIANSEQRPLESATPTTSKDKGSLNIDEIAKRLQIPRQSVNAAADLYGASVQDILLAGSEFATSVGVTDSMSTCLEGTDLPLALAHFAIRAEWATTLDDLVERRLMLHFHRSLKGACLRQLTTALVQQGISTPEGAEQQVLANITRLNERFGKTVVE
ncbi:MAG: glycerol-3-phosphate dehydrogenase/oxidase [Planctomycetota bacterium]|nr:glycerol-3-phosphate dehydrogenase/oxidase [Planctomycetota bacterium]